MTGFETFILVLVLIFLGVPVAYSMLGASLLFGLLNGLPMGSMILRAANSVDSATLLSIPAFIFAATLMNNGGITNRIYEFVDSSRIGGWRGGLAQVNIVGSLIFSGMSGAALADIGGLGKIEMKAMRNAGYSNEDAAAITLSSSIIGPIFPPSIPMLLYAVVAQVSGLQMLLAGVLPGLLLALALMIQVAILARLNNWPTTPSQLTGAQKRHLLLRAFPALMMPVLLLTGLVTGWYSPIELACLAVAYAFFLGAVLYRDLSWRVFIATVAETIISSSGILFLVAGASLFAWVITFEGVADLVNAYLVGTTSNRYAMLFLVIFVLLIWGMVLDMLAALLIFTPILLPSVVALGIDPIQFGVVVCFTLIIGLYTPPVGVCLFLASQITGIPAFRLFRLMAPYYAPIMITLILVALFPPLTTYIPHLVAGR